VQGIFAFKKPTHLQLVKERYAQQKIGDNVCCRDAMHGVSTKVIRKFGGVRRLRHPKVWR
jgi:hypothetical protein